MSLPVSPRPILITVQAPSAAATLLNAASVSSVTPDLNPSNNTSATVQTTVVPVVPPTRADLYR